MCSFVVSKSYKKSNIKGIFSGSSVDEIGLRLLSKILSHSVSLFVYRAHVLLMQLKPAGICCSNSLVQYCNDVCAFASVVLKWLVLR